MRRASIWLLILSVSVISLQGCVTDKPFVKEVSTSDLSAKVVRYQTPKITKTLGTAGTLAMLAVAGSTGVGVSQAIASKRFRDRMPDYGELLMKRFVERAEKEISDFPIMSIENNPLDDDFFFVDGFLIIFKVYNLLVDGSNLFCDSKIKMQNNNKVLGQKYFLYNSKNFGRKLNLEEIKVGNDESLRDEMEFAVETTVSSFIKHFKEGK
jgi:hypothetical protein